MADFVSVLKTAELPSGSKKTVMANGKRLMIANIDGEFFAMDDACTHKGCSLGAEGFLDGSAVTCGCHGGQFDVTTGKVLAGPPTTDERTYDVKVEGDNIMVSL